MPSKDRGKRFQSVRGPAPGVTGSAGATAQLQEWTPGIFVRARLPRPRASDGRGDAGPAGRRYPGKRAARAARPGSGRRRRRGAPSHGSRARSQPESSEFAIVFGEHTNPRSDLRALRFPPGGQSVSSEALYRGLGPELR